jgi:hypothetical protein
VNLLLGDVDRGTADVHLHNRLHLLLQ